MEILGVGYQEILLIVALIVIVVGPRRLPEMAYYLGRGVKKLQHYARVVRDEFSEEFTYINEEMEAVRADVKEMRTTVREVQEELSEARGDVEEATSEAAAEIDGARAGVGQGLPGQGADGKAAPPATTASPARNGSAGEAGVNGAAAPRGVPGPAHLAAALKSGPLAPEAESPAVAEDEAETEAKPRKPLVF